MARVFDKPRTTHQSMNRLFAFAAAAQSQTQYARLAALLKEQRIYSFQAETEGRLIALQALSEWVADIDDMDVPPSDYEMIRIKSVYTNISTNPNALMEKNEKMADAVIALLDHYQPTEVYSDMPAVYKLLAAMHSEMVSFLSLFSTSC